jgi:chitodextrinase
MELMRTAFFNSWGAHSQTKLLVSWLLTIAIFCTILVGFSIKFESANAEPRQNNPPEAVISSPENAAVYDVGEVVHFDASESSDPDNDPLSYSWNFGDGESGEGSQTSHIYSTPWVPIITLTVSDGDLDSTARVVIVIGGGGGQNRPPSASIDEPGNFDSFSIGETIVFDGTSSSDPEEDSLTYVWDFGDGNSSTGMITTHAYTELSPFLVKLTVSDGIFNDSERKLIFVNNTPPTADAGEDQTGYPGKILTFMGTNSSDPDRFSSIDNYTWDMGDKSTKYGSVVTHSYSRYGSFKVTLTVTDNHGATGTDEAKVIITNAQPVANLKLNTPETILFRDIEFDATDSYDPDGDVEEYSYDFGDDTETDWIFDSVVIHSYSVVGEYEITLRVKDDRSEISEPVSLFINVIEKKNQPPSTSISYPVADDSVAGEITIRGTATDPDDGDEIEEVEVKINDDNWDGARITDTDDNSVDWEYKWDTEDVADGEHTIQVRAWDGEDHSTEQSIRVVVNNRPTTFIELTEALKPTTTTPGGKVTVSGKATYDTNVPVANANLQITITETNKKWTTNTDSKGAYSYIITAPQTPGRYTVEVYVTDGSLERETSKKFTVEEVPPDLSIASGDISFSKSRPKDKERVVITVIVRNNGGSDAEGTISFYLDNIQSSTLFDRKDINVEKDNSVQLTATWTAKAGSHNIIVEIKDVVPAEDVTTNNVGTKRIVVVGETQTPEDKSEEGLLDQFNNLSLMYKYGILLIVIIIIIIIILAVASSAKSKRKKKELEASEPGPGRGGMVVFKPLDGTDDDSSDQDPNAQLKARIQGHGNGASTDARYGYSAPPAPGKKQNVKFETIGIR